MKLITKQLNLGCLGLALLGWLVLGVAPARAATYTLGTTTLLVGPAAGSSSVVLGVSPNTGSWTNSTNASWLQLATGYQSGVGSTNVIFNYSAATNTAPRTNTLTIAGQTLTVIQAGSNYVAVNTGTAVATNFSWDKPFFVGVDGSGNVYVNDLVASNCDQEWIKSNNTLSVLATTASFGDHAPYDLVVDKSGNVYFSGGEYFGIYKWTATNGQVTPLVTNGLVEPRGMAVDGAGNLYIADEGGGGSGVVDKWTAATSNLTTLFSPANQGLLDVAVDAAGNVYATTQGNTSAFFNSMVYEWNAANSNVTTFPSSQFFYALSMAVDGSGNLYVADQSYVWEWVAVQGTWSQVGSGFDGPVSVRVDGSGNIYTANYFGQKNGFVVVPNAFVVPDTRTEGFAAGSDSLPAVIPATANLSGPFTPTSSASWLTLTGTNNGVVAFSFGANNTGATRTAIITLLGVPITVNQSTEPPQATTKPATSITATNALLNASVNPEGGATVYFAYGPTTNYGFTNLAGSFSGLGSVPVNEMITGLAPGAIYHFEAIASNSAAAVLGGDLTFTTGPALGLSALAVGPAAGSNSVTLAASGPWTATANASWLQLPTAFQSGANSTNVVFTYSAATNASPRTGTLTIDGLTFTVTQGGTGYVAAGAVVTVLSSNAVTSLNKPSGVAVDGSGNLYIADTDNNAIEEWTATNNAFAVLISSNATTPLNHPYSVAVDGSGNVYIADTGNGAIKEWTATNGNVTTLVSGLLTPKGVALDASTNLYFTDFAGDSLSEWTAANGNVTTLATGSAFLPGPLGVTVDISGKVYICVSNGAAIKVWTPGTAVGSALPTLTAAPSTPNGVAVDGAGNVYIANAGEIEEWTATTATGFDLLSAALAAPVTGVAVDGLESIYVADPGSNEIVKRANAYVCTTTINESGAAGNDYTLEVLPVNQSLLPPFDPSTNASWLSITGITNGVVYFSFTANNTGVSRTADLTVLKKNIPVTQSALPPSATTLAATAITSAAATLNASANPEGAATTVYFAYGPTTNYGSTNAVSAGNGTNSIAVNAGITGLSPATLYHFQALASNTVGMTGGGDLTFTTLAAAPQVTTLAATGITFTNATLNASANPEGAATTVYFAYGPTTNYGSTNNAGGIGAGTSLVAVNQSVTGLLASTLYHFQASASNSLGTTLGGDLTFTTPAGPPQVATLAATHITPTNATLNASVNPEGASTQIYFVYGLTPSFGNFTTMSNAGSGNVLLSASNNITALAPGTLYYFEAIASNSVGTNAGAMESLTTLPTPPVATTVGASNITTSNAMLFGTVNPGGAMTGWYFSYGRTTNYGASTPTNLLASGNALVAVSNAISGLAPATAYHFLLAGTNSAGTNLGGDLTFVTLDIPRAISNVFFSSPGQLCLQFNGGPNGSYTVLTTTNLGLSLSNWTSLGPAALLSNNIYQLIDSHATNAAQFYMLRSP